MLLLTLKILKRKEFPFAVQMLRDWRKNGDSPLVQVLALLLLIPTTI
jgi:hypothetical protein